jgi:hypothetical protein
LNTALGQKEVFKESALETDEYDAAQFSWTISK